MKGLRSRACDSVPLVGPDARKERRRKAKLELKDSFPFFFSFFFKKEQNENDPERTTVPFTAISLGAGCKRVHF